MYENLETLTKARIKIRDLENELAICNTRIVQCEKEKCDLTAVIEELYEKFINKPLEDRIDQLESNLLLLIDAVGGIEQKSNEESPSSENNSEIATIKDADDRSQLETNSRTEATDSRPMIILNSYSIGLSNDCKSMSNDQYHIEDETSVNYDDLVAEIKECFKRIFDGVDKVCDKMSSGETNPTMTPDIRDDEIFTIDSDEDDDFNSADNRLISRPTIPPLIELDDSSCQSDPDDCLLLSDDLIAVNDSTVDQQKANSVSGVSETSPLVDDEDWVFPFVTDTSNSNSANHSNNDERLDDSSNPSQITSVKSESRNLPADPSQISSVESESCNLSAHVNEDSLFLNKLATEITNPKIDQGRTSFSGIFQKSTFDEKPSYYDVSQKSILDDLGDLFNGNGNSNDAARSKICSKNISNLDNASCSKISLNNSFQKPTTDELLDILIENDTSNDVIYSKIDQENTNNLSTEIADNISSIGSEISPEKTSNYEDSPELTLAKLDDVPSKTANRSSIAEYELDKLSIENLNSNSTYSKICQENISFLEISPKLIPNVLGDLSRGSPNPNRTCSKIRQEESAFTELSRKLTISNLDYSSTGNPNFISSTPISNRGKTVFSNVLQKPSSDELGDLSSGNPNSNPACSKIDQEKISSNEVLPKSTPAELGNAFFENANIDVASCLKINEENTSSSEVLSESTLDDLNDLSNKSSNSKYTYLKFNREENAFSEFLWKSTIYNLDNLPAESSKRNTLFGGLLQKPTVDEMDDLFTGNSTADPTCSKISQEKTSSSEVLPKSTLAELDNPSFENFNLKAVSCSKISQEKISPIEVVPKPILAKLTVLSSESINFEALSCSTTSQKETAPSEVLPKSTFAELHTSSDNANLGIASCSKTSPEKPLLSDVSSKQIPADLDDLSTESIKSNSSKCSKINEEKISSIEVPSKSNPNDLDGLSTESIYLDSAKISKTNQENSFTGILQKLSPVKFDDTSLHLGAEINLPESGSEAVGKYAIYDEEISPKNLDNIIVIGVDESSLADLCAMISDDSTDSLTKIDRRTSPIKFELKKDPYEFNDSSTEVQPRRNKHSLFQPTKKVKLPQNDDSDSPTCSRKVFKDEPRPDTEYETNARKRAKYDIYGSYISPAELFFSSNSTSSVEELRRKRMPSWPCPICDECFTNPYFYSKHLNRTHAGDRGVFTCSICQFVAPSITAHKKHVNKWHADAFLMENRYRYVHHITKDHPYATTNFNS